LDQALLRAGEAGASGRDPLHVRGLAAALHSRLSYVAVFAVAFGLRLLVPLTGRGLVGNYSYDASVYYSAGAALVHGRVPYRDFILLHPPGAMLAATPAAWIGRLTSDHTGFALAMLEFTVLGATSAVLVVVVARGLGVGWRGAVVGGLFYAMWLPSVRNEYLSRLEPLGNFLLLCGLVGFVGIGGPHSRRSAVICGVGLGAAISVKLWYGAPMAVVVCFLLARRRPRDAGRVVLGAAAVVLLVCGPILALGRKDAWQMIVLNQLGRAQANPLRELVTLQDVPPTMSWQAAYLLVAVLLVCVGVLAVASRRAPEVRLPAALLLASAAVLVGGPSWYFSYLDFLTPAAALCLATAFAAMGAARHGPGTLVVRSCAIAGAVVVVLALVIPGTRLWYGEGRARASLPSSQLRAAVADVRCIMSDSPMALIGLNVLSRTLANGCPNWVDVTGRTYAPDMVVVDEAGRRVPRLDNPRWQHAIGEYLLSGDAVIVIRAKEVGISPSTWDTIVVGGPLATDGTHTVYRVERRGN
jgi:alpha-1,2-mannosyltransferase